MKFFHLSDLHIGIKLYNRDLLEDQAYILRQITERARQERPDAVIIAGDIYDRAVPSAEAVEVFDAFLSELTAAVPDAAIMMISGNHDSAPRINVYRGILARQKLYMIGQPPQQPGDSIAKVTLCDESGPVNFYLLPFVKPSMVRGVLEEERGGQSSRTVSSEMVPISISSGGERPSDALSSSSPMTGPEKSGSSLRTRSDSDGTGEQGPDKDPVSGAEETLPGGRSALTYEESIRRLIAREEICTQERNVIVSHQFYLPAGRPAEEVERMESEVRTVGNIDAVSAKVLAPFDYAALGHIHKPMKVGSEFIRYCGTPMPYSVSEAGQEKGIIVVEMGRKPGSSADRPGQAAKEGGKPSCAGAQAWLTTRVLALHPRHEVRVLRGSLEEVLRRRCDDYVSVLLTDPIDLDVIDMQDRLREAFPNLLEIRREAVRSAEYEHAAVRRKEMDPFGLCCSFLGDLGQDEQELLKDVIRAVQQEEQR